MCPLELSPPDHLCCLYRVLFISIRTGLISALQTIEGLGKALTPFQMPCFLKAAQSFHLGRIKSQSQVSQANSSQSINHHYMLAAGCSYMTTIHKQDAWCPFMWILCSLHMFVPHELFPWKYMTLPALRCLENNKIFHCLLLPFTLGQRTLLFLDKTIFTEFIQREITKICIVSFRCDMKSIYVIECLEPI